MPQLSLLVELKSVFAAGSWGVGILANSLSLPPNSLITKVPDLWDGLLLSEMNETEVNESGGASPFISW